MPFIFLILLSAFLIEGIGTFISTVGLSTLFASNPVIIALAIALDLAKVVAVSFLYKYFKKLNIIMRTYMTAAVITLMLITSTGAFGYLSGQFQKAIQGTNQDTIVVQSLEDEQRRLQARKQEIDTQIAKLPDNSVRGRRQLIQQFAPEQNKITARLGEIDRQLPELKVESIKKNTDVGPIIYVAQAFNTDPEHAVKWVIFIIIFVFDPLAVSLLLAGNYLIEEREKELAAVPKYESDEAQLAREDVERPTEDDIIKTWDDINRARKSNTFTPPIGAPVNAQEFTPKSPPPPLDINPSWPEPDVIGFPPPMPTKEELHQALGRERYVEPLIDQLDHLSDEDLGRQKPVDIEPTAQYTTTRAIPASKPREIITKDQITKPVKSQLEDTAGGAVDTGLGVKVR